MQTEPLRTVAGTAPHTLVVSVARSEIERCRRAIANGESSVPGAEELAANAASELERLGRPSQRRVINATGVVLHTNLGRAPLARGAIEAVELVAAGYTNLEYDLDAGERGSRNAHVEALLCELTGAEAAIAVNNNAAAVVLTLAALAHGREVVISRGQLVEIGGSFRIPDILGASEARLVEVGTTNRTRIADYEAAIGPETAALMRVHASNFRTVGFVEEVPIEALCALAKERGLFVVDDLGSGVLSGGDAFLADEPAARDSLEAGADVVCFSGDKLLGGPQAGLVVGRRDAIERLRKHPLARAVRIDKLSLAALEATLRVHRDKEIAAVELPVLAMLSLSESELAERAERLRAALAGTAQAEVTIERGIGRAGGGALPLLELDGPVVAVRPLESSADTLHARLRGGVPPVVARIHEGALVLDPRTIAPEELAEAGAVVADALRAK